MGKVWENIEIIQYYSDDYNKNLKKVVNAMLLKHFKGLPQSDYDDFYDIASDVLIYCTQSYDETKCSKFENYFKFVLLKKIKQKMTYKNRDKRTAKVVDESGNKIIVHDYSLESLPSNSLGSYTLEEILPSHLNTDSMIFDSGKYKYGAKYIKYLESLSKLQRDVLELLVDGYLPKEIKEILHITNKQYKDCRDGITSYSKTQLLY